MNYKKDSKIFYRIWTAFSVMLIIPIVAMGVILINQIKYRENVMIENDFQDRAQTVADAIDQKLYDFNHLADRMIFLKWVKLAKSDSELIYNKLDFLQQRYVCEEIANYKAFLGITDTLSVFFPERGIMVDQENWWDISDFLNAKKIVANGNTEQESTLMEVVSKGGTFKVIKLEQAGIEGLHKDDMMIIQGLEIGAAPRAVMVILINSKSLDKYINDINGNKPINLVMRQNGEIIHKSENGPDLSEKNSLMTVKNSIYNLEYEISLAKLETGNQKYFWFIAISIFGMTFFIGISCAYLLTKVTYRPIEKLVAKISSNSSKRHSDNEFAFIERSFEELMLKTDKLEAEVNQYYANARSSFLFKLLEGYFDESDIKKQLEEFSIPFDNSCHVQVVLYDLEDNCDSANREDLQLFLYINQYFSKIGKTVESISLNQKRIVSIFLFNKKEEELLFREQASKFELYLMEKQQLNVDMTFGSLEKGILGISKSYQYAKESFSSNLFNINSFDVKRIQYYYPTDWEVQLINHLKLGKALLVNNILEELRLENQKFPYDSLNIKVISLIYETVLLVVNELNLDAEFLTNPIQNEVRKEDVTQYWQALKEMANQICLRCSDSTCSDIGQNIIQYVNDNFNDYSLSLKELEDKFSISSSKIFRIFKNTANMTFYDYLCRLRIEKAKALFKLGNTNVAEVAKSVGYENEASFKRAFFRYEGVRPKGYIDLM